MTAALLLAGAVLLVAFGGLMAAIDAAFGVTSRSDIEEMGAEGRNGSQLVRIAADPDAHVNAVAFIRVLAETAAAVLVTVAFSILFDNIWWAMLAAALLMTGISFVLVGASPRSFGRHHAEGMLRANARIVRGLRIILGPLAQGLVLLGNRVTPGRGRSSFTSEEQLLSMVDEAASNDLIEADDRDLIHSVFDFTDQFVRAVMVPRTEMVTVDATATTSEAMTLFLQRGVSRMPVVDDDADDVVGVLYLKDLVLFAFRDENAWRTASIRPISRPATFVPESMRAETLLQQMKRDAVHVCLVIDEHGGISGLVTLEDLIEELVGEISDEYDQVSAEVVELGDGRYRVSSRLSLEDVGDLFGLELEDEDVDSIGGLLGKALGQVPQPGSTATVEGLTLTGGASRGRGRGIATVFVERAADDADNAADERDGNDD
ncbi:CBS domain containing-hemolysin-like protein [Microbacterium foliorum]|jgi:CBS domain containing-hemolysin-like protein|uniref:CBS domain containing-hemolysin-like protein n=1 Tax=Microbacterium foliorum TaxID=104336 RepID=A0ABU1HP71_9MICO|nr:MULTISPECIES: hemolysin family protein [Microbacterium]AQY01796.1 hemolysin [Microbacterium foliorum]KIP94199.1 hemolysin [Microbacterium sp. MEJ108Y]KQR43354.1 hemolysin [Microbacterium sp. Leaf161]MDR6141828.1 CBS domain containing-hemolysin-like protein [Microbacterium foliorum]